MKGKLTIPGLILLLTLPVVLALLVACGHSAPTATGTPTPTETMGTPTVTYPEIVEVVSALGPLPPINPGGPTVMITLKNVADVPITSLNATLDLSNRSFEFNFVTATDNPLPPGATASAKMNLIGGGFDNDSRYNLTVNGELQGAGTFTVYKQIQIIEPQQP